MKPPISCFGLAAVAMGFLTSSWVLAAQQRPVFRSGVEAVAVDVVVVDGDGNPVTDLTVEDFTLQVDGKPRTLVSIEYVPMTSDEPATPATDEDLHVSTNADMVPGRLVLFVVDQESIRMGEGKPAMEAAKRFLDHLSSNDRVGLLTIPRGGTRIDFTSNKDKVRNALGQIVGLGTRTSGMYNIGLTEALAIRRRDRYVTEEVVGRECSADPVPGCPDLVKAEAESIANEAHWRAKESLLSLHSITEALKEIDSPKVLVLISQGLVQDVDTFNDIVPVTRSAAAARVSLYAIQVDSPIADASRQRAAPTPLEDLRLLADGMGTLAGMTRGALFRGGASYDSALARIERELAGYYLLAFEAEAGDRDGEPHKIEVSCRRSSGTILRSRSEFVIPEVHAEEDESAELTRALRNPFPSTALPLEATAYKLLDPGSDRQKLLLVAQIGRDPQWPRSASLAWAVLNDSGNAVAGRFETLTQEEGRTLPLRFVQSIPIEPGNYTVRVAAKDEAGSLGSVEHLVHVVERKAEELELSDLVLVDSMRPGVPLTSVVTGSVSGVRAYVEIGSMEPNLPSGLRLSFDVIDPNDGKSVAQTTVEVRKAEQTGRWMAEATVPLRSLPSQDYVLRAELSIDGRPRGNMERRFLWRPSAEVAAMNAEDLPIGPPRDYAELVERYLQGGFANAARALARWSRESVEAATGYFETRVLTDRERLSAALLHTDVVLRSVAEEDFHLEAAERFLAGIQDLSLRRTIERQWFILVGEHLRYQIRDGVAVSFLEPALEQFPDDGELIVLYGAICEAAGWMRKDDGGPWLDGAEKLYRRLLEADPEHAEAHLRLGHIYKLKRRHEDATREIQSSLDLDHTPEIEAVAQLLMGDMHRAGQETAKAIASYRAAMVIEPHFKAAATALSYSLFQAGELDESREVMQEFYAVEESPTDVHDLWWRYLRGHREIWVARMILMRKELP